MLDFVAKYEATSTTALSAATAWLLTINGWILMQRKVTPSAEYFSKNWNTYLLGIGHATGNLNYWLGLENVYSLMQLCSVKLRIEVGRCKLTAYQRSSFFW